MNVPGVIAWKNVPPVTTSEMVESRAPGPIIASPLISSVPISCAGPNVLPPSVETKINVASPPA